MPIEDIIKTIEDEVTVKTTGIKKENEEKLKKISEEYDKKIAKAESEIVAKIEDKIKKRLKKEQFSLNTKEGKILLEKKWELVNDAYKTAFKKLLAMSDKGKSKLFAEWLKKCPNKGEIIAAKNDVAVLKSIGFEGNISGSEEISGGFIFKTESMIIDFTLEKIVAQLKETTEVEVGNILFG